jgi:hypothetical protein
MGSNEPTRTVPCNPLAHQLLVIVCVLILKGTLLRGWKPRGRPARPLDRVANEVIRPRIPELTCGIVPHRLDVRLLALGNDWIGRVSVKFEDSLMRRRPLHERVTGFVFLVSVLLLLGCTTSTFALSLLSGSLETSGPAAPGRLQALINSHSRPSLPRSSTRDDLLEPLRSDEEDDDCLEARSGAVALWMYLDPNRTPLNGLLSIPSRREVGSFPQQASSRPRC